MSEGGGFGAEAELPAWMRAQAKVGKADVRCQAWAITPVEYHF